MIITLLFCFDVKWQISQQTSLFPKLLLWLCHWQITPLSFWKHPVVIVKTFKVKVYLAVSRHFPALPFRPVLVLAFFAWQLFSSLHLRLAPFLGKFLGVRLYSNYNIGRQNFERVLCLILPTVWLNLLLLLYCVVNLISESASQGEGCCIIVRDQW